MASTRTGRSVGASPPLGAAEIGACVRAARRGASGEAVGEWLLLLAQDVDRVAAGPAQRRHDPPAAIEGDQDERRPQRNRAERVDGGSPGPLVIPGRDHRHARREAAEDGPEGLGIEVGHGRSLAGAA